MPKHSEASLETEARNQLKALVECAEPLLIGVRHHSPALAAAMGAMLDAFKPDIVLIEMPAEFDPWLEWLGHPETLAPVALAAVPKDGQGLSFYPFAEFSPEFAAVRWCVQNKVAVQCCDLPAGARVTISREAREIEDGSTITHALQRRFHTDDFESLWDRAVEVHVREATPEALRRTGLYVGWALRADAAQANNIDPVDATREAYMRDVIASHKGKRIAAVIGSFHAAALLPEAQYSGTPHATENPESPQEMITSFIPYAFELLDSRSMYPAGIRDPMWQQGVFEATKNARPIEDMVAEIVVSICRNIRAQGHVAGVPDADAATRMALDLARLRDLPGPGRQEIIESIQSALARGEVSGRGRILASAMDDVLVGRRRGRLPQKAPRSGLLVHVLDELNTLGLPGPSSRSEPPKNVKLEPLRTPKDRKRHVLLKRLAECGIPYAQEQAVRGLGNAQAVTTSWDIQWKPSTDAMIEFAGIWGVTIEQATRGAILTHERKQREKETYTSPTILGMLRATAECGLPDLTRERLDLLDTEFLPQADLGALLEALRLLESLRSGLFPGLIDDQGQSLVEAPEQAPFLAAALRAVEGLVGSTAPADVQNLMELVVLFKLQNPDDSLGDGRLRFVAETFVRDGSPLMQGAATAAQWVLAAIDEEELKSRTGAWIDSGVDADSREVLAHRLQGLLAAASSMLEADATPLGGVVERIQSVDDDGFLERLPALRRGFDGLSFAARDKLLETLQDAFPEVLDPRGRRDLVLDDDPQLIGLLKTADLRTGNTLFAMFGPLTTVEHTAPAAPSEGIAAQAQTTHQLDPLTRWKLILGRERDRSKPMSGAAARALDQLYGQGEGEGSGRDIGDGGGQEDAFPSVREWADEIQAIFGDRVREEVLATAIGLGHTAAALELDSDHVQPSVELLESLLSLRGGMSEAQLTKLRALIKKVTEALVKKLANKLTPALSGLSTPRPTRRKGGPIDLKRTILANLARAHRREDGSVRIVPERIYFKTRAKRSLGWHISLVVDVSGSMEASVIYSALMASILQALPAISVSFIAFNTQVIDLSHLVDDPLGLLLEVQVGGGTHIGKALKYAREHITVPNRTILCLITDFEEGWAVDGMLRETRELAESGVHCLGLAALDDSGKPRYNNAIAGLMVGAGMPVAALTPLELAEWVGDVMRGKK